MSDKEINNGKGTKPSPPDWPDANTFETDQPLPGAEDNELGFSNFDLPPSEVSESVEPKVMTENTEGTKEPDSDIDLASKTHLPKNKKTKPDNAQKLDGDTPVPVSMSVKGRKEKKKAQDEKQDDVYDNSGALKSTLDDLSDPALDDAKSKILFSLCSKLSEKYSKPTGPFYDVVLAFEDRKREWVASEYGTKHQVEGHSVKQLFDGMRSDDDVTASTCRDCLMNAVSSARSYIIQGDSGSQASNEKTDVNNPLIAGAINEYSGGAPGLDVDLSISDDAIANSPKGDVLKEHFELLAESMLSEGLYRFEVSFTEGEPDTQDKLAQQFRDAVLAVAKRKSIALDDIVFEIETAHAPASQADESADAEVKEQHAENSEEQNAEKHSSSEWFMAQGGLEALTDEQQVLAKKEYEAWLESREGNTENSFSFEQYVTYRQDKNAEDSTSPGPRQP